MLKEPLQRFRVILALVGTGLSAASCMMYSEAPGTPTDEAASRLDREDALKIAQMALVDDVAPATYKTRFRRALDEPSDPTSPPAYPPYDFTGTQHAAAASKVMSQIDATVSASGWPREIPQGKKRIVFTDLANREEWEQEYDIAELEELFDVAKATGINAPGGLDRPESSESPSIEKGWSYAYDSRVNKPINSTYPITHATLMRMGQVNRGCTGTLVGRRLVLTAAHCVVSSDLSQNNQQYRARGSGATEPFGVVNTAAYWWDAAYSNNNCQNVYTIATRETCGRYDWALLLLPDDAWDNSPNGTPSWMGYWVPGQTAMENNYYARNDGYPLCSPGSAPSGCVANTAYGETYAWNSVLFRGPDTSGWNSIFQTANDISPGHSGSAVWSNVYPYTSTGGYVLAVVTNELCGTCASQSGTTRSHPAMVRRITPWVAGFITTQRTNYP